MTYLILVEKAPGHFKHFRCNATQVDPNAAEVIFSSKEKNDTDIIIGKAIAASCAIATQFAPININGKKYVDAMHSAGNLSAKLCKNPNSSNSQGLVILLDQHNDKVDSTEGEKEATKHPPDTHNFSLKDKAITKMEYWAGIVNPIPYSERIINAYRTVKQCKTVDSIRIPTSGCNSRSILSSKQRTRLTSLGRLTIAKLNSHPTCIDLKTTAQLFIFDVIKKLDTKDKSWVGMQPNLLRSDKIQKLIDLANTINHTDIVSAEKISKQIIEIAFARRSYHCGWFSAAPPQTAVAVRETAEDWSTQLKESLPDFVKTIKESCDRCGSAADRLDKKDLPENTPFTSIAECAL